MTDDTVLDGKPIFSDPDSAADELEMCWNEYRKRIWKELPFEMRLQHAWLNRKMSRTLAVTANLLRQSSKDLNECDTHIEKLERTIDRIQAE